MPVPSACGTILLSLKISRKQNKEKTTQGSRQNFFGGCLYAAYLRLETEIDWLWQKPDWTDFKAIGAVRSCVTKKGVEHQETRYYITSLTDVNKFAHSVRKHWSIENQLHWMLDVVFHEDASRARKGNSPLNLNVLRKTALSILKPLNLGKNISIRKKMLKAALNPSILEVALFKK